MFNSTKSLLSLGFVIFFAGVYFVYHSVPAAKARLHSADPAMRCAAAEDLGQRGPEAQSALPTLKSMLNDTQCTKFSEEVGGFYLQQVGGIDALIDVARTGNRRAQWTVYRRLRLTAPEHPAELQKLKEVFAEGLKNQDTYVRLEASAGITALGPRAADVVPELENLLTDSNADVRLSAIGAIVKVRSVDALRRALTNPDPEVRYQAVFALGGMSNSEFGGVLGQWNEYDPDETEAARQKRMAHGPPQYSEFKGYGPKVIPALVAALDDPAEKNATRAAESLGFLHHEGLPALEGLEHAVREAPSLSTRIAAIDSIREIGPEGRPFIEEETWDLNSSIREEALQAYRTLSEKRPSVVCPAKYTVCIATQNGILGFPANRR